tara:strand:- start:5126 stop:5464 length:339 start_codon:yes stop_codon:yes gene_type:complete
VNRKIELAPRDAFGSIAIITNDSAERIELETDSKSLVLINSSWLLLNKGLSIRESAQNLLTGVVSQIMRSEINAEVTLALGDSKTMTAIVILIQGVSLNQNFGQCRMATDFI